MVLLGSAVLVIVLCFLIAGSVDDRGLLEPNLKSQRTALKLWDDLITFRSDQNCDIFWKV